MATLNKETPRRASFCIPKQGTYFRCNLFQRKRKENKHDSISPSSAGCS